MCNKFIQYVMKPVCCSVVNCIKLVRKKSSPNINKDFRPKNKFSFGSFKIFFPGREIKNSIFFFFMWHFQMFLHLLDGESVGKKVGMRVGGGGCVTREKLRRLENRRALYLDTCPRSSWTYDRGAAT